MLRSTTRSCRTSWLEDAPVSIPQTLKGGRILDEGLDPTAIRKIVKTRCLQAGLQGDFSAHSLRSGFVTEECWRRCRSASIRWRGRGFEAWIRPGGC
jgi:hypothetical protein